jgi:hypothetical protein
VTDLLPEVVTDIVAGLDALDPRRRERGLSDGRWTSTPASRRAPVNLDVLVLTDRRTGVLAVLMHWAGRIRHAQRLPHPRTKSVRSEAAVLGVYWRWALEQPWGPDMLDELAVLSGAIHVVRFGVPVRPCPVCREPVRLDRFVAEHRSCIETPLA